MNWYKWAAFHDYTKGKFSPHNTEVFVNPSIWEFRSMGPARVIVDASDGSVYAASDAESTHFDIRETIDKEGGVEGFAYIMEENIVFDLRTQYQESIIKLIQNHIPNAVSKESFNELV